MTNRYDALLRKNYVAVKTPGGQTVAATDYGYDGASRLSSLTGNGSASYSYVPNSLARAG